MWSDLQYEITLIIRTSILRVHRIISETLISIYETYKECKIRAFMRNVMKHAKFCIYY